jgi:hypothetical protein
LKNAQPGALAKSADEDRHGVTLEQLALDLQSAEYS